MNLEAINAVAQLIAARGMVLSRFYLRAPIGQNIRSIRSVRRTAFAPDFRAYIEAIQPIEGELLLKEVIRGRS